MLPTLGTKRSLCDGRLWDVVGLLLFFVLPPLSGAAGRNGTLVGDAAKGVADERAINPRNSRAALVNAHRKLIGIPMLAAVDPTQEWRRTAVVRHCLQPCR
jgi:hypothetical protein